MNKKELNDIYEEYRRLIYFASDIEGGVCQINYTDYLNLPATTVDFLRIFKNKITEIKNANNK